MYFLIHFFLSYQECIFMEFFKIIIHISELVWKYNYK